MTRIDEIQDYRLVRRWCKRCTRHCADGKLCFQLMSGMNIFKAKDAERMAHVVAMKDALTKHKNEKSKE